MAAVGVALLPLRLAAAVVDAVVAAATIPTYDGCRWRWTLCWRPEVLQREDRQIAAQPASVTP